METYGATKAVLAARHWIGQLQKYDRRKGRGGRYVAALVLDLAYELAPTLRLVTSHTSLPLTVGLLEGLDEIKLNVRVNGDHHVVLITPTESCDGVVLLPDLDEPDEPVGAVEVTVSLHSAHPTKATLATMTLGKNLTSSLFDAVVISCDRKPNGWPG